MVQGATADVVVSLKCTHYKCHKREVPVEKHSEACLWTESSDSCSCSCSYSSEEVPKITLCTSCTYTVVNALAPTDPQPTVTLKAAAGDSFSSGGLASDTLVVPLGQAVTIQNYQKVWYVVA